MSAKSTLNGRVPKSMYLPAELLDAINRYRHEHYFRFEADAVHQLLKAGLEAERRRSVGEQPAPRMVRAR